MPPLSFARSINGGGPIWIVRIGVEKDWLEWGTHDGFKSTASRHVSAGGLDAVKGRDQRDLMEQEVPQANHRGWPSLLGHAVEPHATKDYLERRQEGQDNRRPQPHAPHESDNDNVYQSGQAKDCHQHEAKPSQDSATESVRFGHCGDNCYKAQSEADNCHQPALRHHHTARDEIRRGKVRTRRCNGTFHLSTGPM